MITSTIIKGFGPVRDFQWNGTGRINLVIGPNKSGKTYLLKALYSAVKTVEAYKRGKEVRRDAEILFDKLYWTYQPDQLGKQQGGGVCHEYGGESRLRVFFRSVSQ